MLFWFVLKVMDQADGFQVEIFWVWPKETRFVGPGEVMTEDYEPERLTVY